MFKAQIEFAPYFYLQVKASLLTILNKENGRIRT